MPERFISYLIPRYVPIAVCCTLVVLLMAVDIALAAPEAVDDAYTTAFETPLAITNPADGLLANDLTDGPPLEVFIGQNVDPDLQSVMFETMSGDVTLYRDGTFTYVPDLLFNGIDSFTYTVTDGETITVMEATVTLTVNEAGLVAAQNDFYMVGTGEALIVSTLADSVLANDGPNTVMLEATIENTATIAGGTVTLALDGTFTYEPPLAFIGDDTFTYTAGDTGSETNTAIATVTISVVNLTATPADLHTDLPVYVGAPVYPVFSWTAAAAGEWYHLVVLDGEDSVIVNQWYPATNEQSPLTGQTPICLGVQCAVQPTELPNWTFGDGEYSWYVGAWDVSRSETRYNAVENAGQFNVDVPQPKNAGFTVNTATGWPVITWPDDNAIIWVQVWIGPGGLIGSYQAWHGRGVTDGPIINCDGETCEMVIPWDGESEDNPYQLWLQTWGPGGYGEGTDGNWFQVTAGMLLPTAPSDLPTDIITQNGNTPQVTFTGRAGFTWYRVRLAAGNNQWINAFGGMEGWYPAEDLGCLGGGGKICTVPFPYGGAGLPDGSYRIYLQAWGPGGYGINGNFPDDSALSWLEFDIITGS